MTAAFHAPLQTQVHFGTTLTVVRITLSLEATLGFGLTIVTPLNFLATTLRAVYLFLAEGEALMIFSVGSGRCLYANTQVCIKN